LELELSTTKNKDSASLPSSTRTRPRTWHSRPGGRHGQGYDLQDQAGPRTV